MYTEKRKKRWPGILLLCICAAALVSMLRSSALKDDSGEGSLSAVKTAVLQAARQCYVVEGVYPPDLKYLQENYGLHVNTKDFYISYDAFAQNLLPEVRVRYRYE